MVTFIAIMWLLTTIVAIVMTAVYYNKVVKKVKKELNEAKEEWIKKNILG